ncbi:MAG: hypothetical protein H9533_12625 [Rhodobacteraceae bacterium]|nr:hypothetical protein [Paracoccaceae bacterium]
MTLDLGKSFLRDGSSALPHVVSSSPDTNTASSHCSGDAVPVKVPAQNSMADFRIGPLGHGHKQIKLDVTHGAFCGGIASAHQVQMGLGFTRPSPEEELNLDRTDDVTARISLGGSILQVACSSPHSGQCSVTSARHRKASCPDYPKRIGVTSAMVR